MKLTQDQMLVLDGLADSGGIADLPDGAFEQVLIDRIEASGEFKGRDARAVLYAYMKTRAK